jgi:electron transport complex protein RnfB
VNDPTPPWHLNKPAMTAFIREDECIGCTKCLPDCPTDAIMGAAKLMHTVITNACTACELCIPTCPVDCIEMRPVTERSIDAKKSLNITWLNRFTQHNHRIAHQKKEAPILAPDTVEARKNYIAEALKRVKRNKTT